MKGSVAQVPRVVNEAEGAVEVFFKKGDCLGSIHDEYTEKRSAVGIGDGSHPIFARIVVKDVEVPDPALRHALLNHHGYVRRRRGDVVQICFDPTPRGHNLRKSSALKERESGNTFYKDMASWQLKKKCEDKMLASTGKRDAMIAQIISDDKDLAQEKGAILKFRLCPASTMIGSFLQAPHSATKTDAPPPIKIINEALGSTKCRLMSYTEALYVLSRKPSVVEQILCSVPAIGKHESIGVRLFLALQAVFKEHELEKAGQTTDPAETKPAEDAQATQKPSGYKSAVAGRWQKATAKLSSVLTAGGGQSRLTCRDEAELLCNELHMLSEGVPVHEEDMDNPVLFDRVARAAAAATEHMREWRLLFVVTEWLQVSPTCSALEYMIRRLERHCREEDSQISYCMNQCTDAIHVKMTKIMQAGEESGNLDLLALASRQDLTSNCKVEVLITFLAPEYLPDPDDVDDGELVTHIARVMERCQEFRVENHSSSSLGSSSAAGEIDGKRYCPRCCMWKLSHGFYQVDWNKANAVIICKDCKKHQGFLFVELVKFIYGMPLGVVDRILVEMYAITDELREKGEDFFQDCLQSLQDMMKVINGHSERRFFESEKRFASALQALKFAKERSAHAKTCDVSLTACLDTLIEESLKWWLLRMCRHLVRPFRSHCNAQTRKLREAIVQGNKGTQMGCVRVGSRFKGANMASDVVVKWWINLKQQQGLASRADDTSDSDEEGDAKPGPTLKEQNTRKMPRLDGLLNYSEFEMLLCSSGGASLGCDRSKMLRLFHALDCDRSGKVSMLEVAEVSQALREICQAIRSGGNRKLDISDVRLDLRRQCRALAHKFTVPEPNESVRVFF